MRSPPHFDLRTTQNPVIAWQHSLRCARCVGVHRVMRNYAPPRSTGTRQQDALRKTRLHHPAPPVLGPVLGQVVNVEDRLGEGLGAYMVERIA